MRRNVLILGLSLAFLSSGALAQQNTALPTITEHDMYCSGILTTNHVPRGTVIVSGQEAEYQITFADGDYVYINKGSNKGVKPGDVYQVMRPVSNDTGMQYFSWQNRLLHAMGQAWQDEGRLKVVVAHRKVSIAQVTDACGYLQRGDVVLPFIERPAPPPKTENNFDPFAPPSGKKKAMIVAGKDYAIVSGTNSIVYVNLGSNQGVIPGDYFRIFHYQNNGHSLVYQRPHMATQVYGFGAAPRHYSSKELPRQVVGEGIVLRTSPNASTVLITYSLEEIYEGDYCELE